MGQIPALTVAQDLSEQVARIATGAKTSSADVGFSRRAPEHARPKTGFQQMQPSHAFAMFA